MNESGVLLKLKIRREMSLMMLEEGKGLSETQRAYHQSFADACEWMLDRLKLKQLDRLTMEENLFYQKYMSHEKKM